MTNSFKIFKAIDHYIGLPICVVISAIYGLYRFIFGVPQKPINPKNILIIKFFGLGSIGYSTLIARNLKKQYPACKFFLLTFYENRAFADNLQVFDEILTVEKRAWHLFVADTIKFLIRCLNSPFDICIDLEFFSKYTSMLTAATRAPQRIGFFLNCFWRRFIYTDHSYFNTAKHVSFFYSMIADLSGVNQPDQKPAALHIKPEDSLSVNQKLLSLGWDGNQGIVGININASDLALGRRWPLDRFRELIEAVAKDGFLVCMTGASSERKYVQTCMQGLAESTQKSAINLAGQIDLNEFIALLKMLKLFVTNDSGPMIFSILADAASVSIWGPGDLKMYGGSPPLHTYCYSAFPCSPCMYIPNTDAGFFCGRKYPCMAAIQAKDVIFEVRRRLGMGN